MLRIPIIALLFIASRAQAQTGHIEADAGFVRDMIGHHAQALQMTALVPERTQRPDVRIIAERIQLSQDAEIAQMRRWLQARKLAVPDSAAAHHEHHDGHTMPGMLSAEEMAQLRAARGQEFERLFAELMIKHHEGALLMIEQLKNTPGAGEEAELFQMISHIDADQRAEIARLRRLIPTTVKETRGK